MIDWNGNGKHDGEDDFLDFMIANDVMKDYEDDFPIQQKAYKPRNAAKSDKSGKNKVSSPEINGGSLLGGWIMIFLAVYFTYFKADNTDVSVSLAYIGLGLCSVAIGVWFMSGKRIVKKKYWANYGYDDKEKNTAGKIKSVIFFGVVIIIAVVCFCVILGSGKEITDYDDDVSAYAHYITYSNTTELNLLQHYPFTF